MKLLKILFISLALLVIVVIAGMWSVGMFQKIEFKAQDVGAMTMVYTEHIGPYNKIGPKFEIVKKYLDDNKIAYTYGIGEYLDNPAKVRQEELRSYAGYLVDKPIKTAEPIRVKKIQKNYYVVCTFVGMPMVGPFVVYPKATKWFEKNGYEMTGAAYEIYKIDGKIMSTDYLFAVKKK
ncbi:MAG: hypothetical protein A2252_07650 [Elusimicrobia bacterium RIFOXYA2_FULL_39_19]|nr:MAG: hypothetical protein A2252_07650 [Elusimicrobia bacterium RIFOXYA2_FULL_39_19]